MCTCNPDKGQDATNKCSATYCFVVGLSFTIKLCACDITTVVEVSSTEGKSGDCMHSFSNTATKR